METGENNQSGRDRSVHDEAVVEVPRSEDSGVGEETMTLEELCVGFIVDVRDFLLLKNDNACKRVGAGLAEILSLFLMPPPEDRIAARERIYEVAYCVAEQGEEAALRSETYTQMIKAESPEKAVELIKGTVRETLSRRVEILGTKEMP